MYEANVKINDISRIKYNQPKNRLTIKFDNRQIFNYVNNNIILSRDSRIMPKINKRIIESSNNNSIICINIAKKKYYIKSYNKTNKLVFLNYSNINKDGVLLILRNIMNKINNTDIRHLQYNVKPLGYQNNVTAKPILIGNTKNGS